MMKKLWLGLAALVLVMGMGTSVYAASVDKEGSFFEKMLPFAKQMHPDLTDTQIKDMIDNCHSDSKNRGGMMNF